MNTLKRGNIVKILVGGKAWNQDGLFIDPSPELIGKEAVIEYSYGERYGNGDNTGDFSILFLDTGCSRSWFSEDQLEYVSDGGDEVINDCKKRCEEMGKKMRDICWIKDNWKTKDGLSAATMLTLFHKIGYNSSFESNGEYFCLYDDWSTLGRIFEAIFDKDIEKVKEHCDTVFTPKFKSKYTNKCIDFYNEVWV